MANVVVMPVRPCKRPSSYVIPLTIPVKLSPSAGIERLLPKSALAILATSLLLTAHAGGRERAARPPDVWQSPQVERRRTELPRARRDTGPAMPLMEISLISRACRKPAFQAAVGLQGDECAKAMFRVKRECTRSFHRKFPRGDNQEVDGRLAFRRFFDGYEKCLRKKFAKKARRLRPARR